MPADTAIPEERYAYDQSPDGQRRDLLDHVREGGRVLDVGCWSGFNGKYLLSRGCTLYGVELDPVAASMATHYQQVCVGDLEDEAVLDEALSYAPFDAILALDILEHTSRPSEILKRLTGALHDNGRMLISLPNVAHWTTRKHLLMGRWDYAPAGILDRSHLRFFTLETARSLLCDGGVQIEWEGGSSSRLPLLPPMARSERWLAKRFAPVFAVQLFFVGRPADERRDRA